MSGTNPTRLVLIRHGHTDGNGGSSQVRMSGWTDLPLSARGLREAERVAERLRGSRIAALYSSSLSRAADTARALERAGLGTVVLSDDLREVSAGAVDGLPAERVKRELPEHWESNLRQDDDDFRWPDGESYAELRRRSLRAVREIAARHPGGRVAIVTHAGVIGQIVGEIRGTRAARWERFRPGNGSITEIDWLGETGVVVSFDDRTHLDEEPHDAARVEGGSARIGCASTRAPTSRPSGQRQ